MIILLFATPCTMYAGNYGVTGGGNRVEIMEWGECMRNDGECMRNDGECMRNDGECMRNGEECMRNLGECMRNWGESGRGRIG